MNRDQALTYSLHVSPHGAAGHAMKASLKTPQGRGGGKTVLPAETTAFLMTHRLSLSTISIPSTISCPLLGSSDMAITQSSPTSTLASITPFVRMKADRPGGIQSRMSFIVKMRFIVWDGKYLIYLIISMRQLGMEGLLVCHPSIL
jgi:hypothetical protein